MLAKTIDKDFEAFQTNMQRAAFENVHHGPHQRGQAAEFCYRAEDIAAHAHAHGQRSDDGGAHDDRPARGARFEHEVLAFLCFLHLQLR